MPTIKYTLVLQIRGVLKQSNVEIPDTWQYKPKEWVIVFNRVDPNTIVILIPTTQVKGLISILSQPTTS